MEFKTGDRVTLTTAKLDVFGTVATVEPSGLVWVKWDGQPEFDQASGPYSAYELRSEGSTVTPCLCEHTNHFNDQFGPIVGHEYTAADAGNAKALYVGSICDACASTCMVDYLI